MAWSPCHTPADAGTQQSAVGLFDRGGSVPGYLQEAPSRRFAERAHGEAFAVAVAAGLFGIAHAAGGVAYVIVAGLAGVGYGLAYRAGGLQAAVLAHFGLNLSHFTLFTYPMLAS